MGLFNTIIYFDCGYMGYDDVLFHGFRDHATPCLLGRSNNTTFEDEDMVAEFRWGVMMKGEGLKEAPGLYDFQC
jgi:hypothetical protein